jgi:cysteine synthase A
MLEVAESTGQLQPGMTIIESTSGSLGLALALLAQQRGYEIVLICDGDIEASLRRRLIDLGARVVIPNGSSLQAGAQAIRLARLDAVRQQIPNHFCPNQYDDPENRRGYWSLGDLIAATVRVDVVVAAVGTGGSSCGTVERLRRTVRDVTLVGVDTPGSMLFGHGVEPRLLKGLGNSILPANVRHEMFDEVHWVDAAVAFRATRELHQQSGLYMGPTSGAAYLCASWYAESHPDEHVVVLMADQGHRYEASVYDDAWLRENAWLEALPRSPVEVSQPAEVAEPWCRLEWARRRLDEVRLPT